MRHIWNGTVNVGLLSIPVVMGSGRSSKEIELHQYGPSGGRIKHRNIEDGTGNEVAYSQIRKGYAAPDGTVVYLTDEDFMEAYGGVSRNAQVIMFTEGDLIPDSAKTQPFILMPTPQKGRGNKQDRGHERAYALLAATLWEEQKVAIVLFGLRQRKRLAAISATRYSGGYYLVLEQLEWAEDLVEPDFDAPAFEFTEAELSAAKQMVGLYSDKFDYSAQKDDSRERLAATVEKRIAEGKLGTGYEIPDAAPSTSGAEQCMDLMAVLTASVEAARAARSTA